MAAGDPRQTTFQLTGGHGGRREGGGTPGFDGAYPDWKEEGREGRAGNGAGEMVRHFPEDCACFFKLR